MRNALAIARKELSIYFTTPWAYVVFTAMAAIGSFFFMSTLGNFAAVQDQARLYGWSALGQDAAPFKNLTDGVVIQLWGIFAFVGAFASPFVSMRLFAEERRQKTFELLMTSPVRPFEIVLGKYLGGVIVMSSTVGITIVYPLILEFCGHSAKGTVLDWSTVLTGYVGLLAFIAAAVAIGMFISSLTESQAIAAMITVVVILAWFFLGLAIPYIDDPSAKSVVRYLTSTEHLQDFFRGVIDLKSLVYFGSVILFSLLLTHRTVEAQRWT
jgi:ABC-2 type transport system permease protein